MEHKPKFMTSRSCEGQGARSIIARFSNLPDEVADHILSFVAITDLTRFGCVSQRCRKLSLSTPTLNFDLRGYNSTSKRKLLSNFLDGFLVRRGDKKIQYFHITCPYYSEDYPLLKWIQYAVRCNVEVLDLKISSNSVNGPFSLPSGVFLLKSLRSLMLSECRMVKAPSLDSLSNLKHLELSYLDDEGFFKWISSSCKHIRSLNLHRVYGIHSVTVESASLTSIIFMNYDPELIHLSISGEKLEEMYLQYWRFPYINTRSKSLNIFAPNLKYLFWRGGMVNGLNLGNMSLERADLLLELILNSISEVLYSLCRVKQLILNRATFKALSKVVSEPAPLDNLRYLEMQIWNFSDELVQLLASLLRGMPNLCTLCIKTELCCTIEDTSGIDMGYWELQKLDFISQVKKVTMEIYNGSNGIELAGYILKHAQNLENMVIRYLPHVSEGIMKLKNVKSNSSATVVFDEVPPQLEVTKAAWI